VIGVSRATDTDADTIALIGIAAGNGVAVAAEAEADRVQVQGREPDSTGKVTVNMIATSANHQRECRDRTKRKSKLSNRHK